MESKTILETLRRATFTHGLEANQLETLAALAFEATFSAGQIIFREGDLGDVVYLIEEGLAAVEHYVPGQGSMTILTVGPGQVLGWSAFFPNKRKTAGGRALCPTKAIAFSAPQLREACEQDPRLGYAFTLRLADLIADRLKATRLQLMDIFKPAVAAESLGG